MRKYLFASHGQLAAGMKDTLGLILGEVANIDTLCAYTPEHPNLKQSIENKLAALSANDELIVLTDIFRGSVNNEFMNYLADKRIHIVCGLNLSLAINVIIENDEADTEALIRQALIETKETMLYLNDVVKNANSIDLEDF